MTDPSWIIKLWWHRVDIAASVIAGAINTALAAIAARLFWNFKKKRDLQFEKEKIQLQATEHRRLTNAANAEQNKLALEKKVGERAAIAERIELSSTTQERHDALKVASQWITSQGLDDQPNAEHAGKVHRFANAHLNSEYINERICKELAIEVRAIRFPEEYLPPVR